MEGKSASSERVPVTRTILLASVALIVFYLVKLYNDGRVFRNLRKLGLPMPKYNSIFGHLLVLKEKMAALPPDCTINTSFLMMAEDYPDGIFCFDLWPISRPILLVKQPSAATHMATELLNKPPQVNQALLNLTGGENLFTMAEAEWKPWRSLFNPGFSAGYILELVPAIAKETKVFQNILRQKAHNGTIFQLEDLTLKLTIDVICAVSIDKTINYQLHDHVLGDALRTQIEWASFGAELNPFSRYNPFRPLVLWYNNRKINRYIYAEINDRFLELKSGTSSGSEKPYAARSIISLALRDYIKEKGLENQKTVDREFQKVAASQLRLFLFAGHDTTSSTLIYCYHLLATHPECMELIRKEQDDVFGTDRTQVEQLLTEKPQLLNKLSYTQAVIKEVLRLFPPASGFRDGRPGVDVVDDSGRRFPTEGCYVWAMHLVIQRNPKYFKDPHSFIPDRWLVGPEHPLYPVKGAWRPFEFGPRNCLGQTLAMAELKVVLAMTVRDFDIRPAYEQWDKEHNATHIKTVLGNRAYQVEGGGGGAHAADRYPCKVSIRN